MRPESLAETDGADEEARSRRGRRVCLVLGIAFLNVVLGAVPLFLLLGGPETRLGRSLGFGATGPTVNVRSGPVGPIDLQRSPALADAGVEVKHVGSSASSRGSILGNTETRGFTVRVTPRKAPIEPEDLTFTLIDDHDKVIGEGTLKLPGQVEIGESADGKLDVILLDDDGVPATLIIGRKGE